MLEALFSAQRSTKRVVSICYDVLALAFSYYLAVSLRLGHFDIPFRQPEALALGTTIAIAIASFIKLGLYRAILRYLNSQAVFSIAVGIGFASATLAISGFYFHAYVPRSVPIIFFFTSLILIGIPRLLMRSIVALIYGSVNKQINIIIYGAGDTGCQLIRSLGTTAYHAVAFVDDNKTLQGSVIAGLKVYPSSEIPKLIKNHNATITLLALGSVGRQQKTDIIRKLELLGTAVKTIPPIHEIVEGKARISDIQDVSIEDLLGREPVLANPELLSRCIENKTVMVTGAGGSIGSELCRQILRLNPTTLILFEIAEYNLYSIEQELTAQCLNMGAQCTTRIIPIMGSVQNPGHLNKVMRTYGVNTVYHAAAYKHVPLVEHNIIEGVRNNIFGTLYCAKSAIEAGVESFVLISTDKAVRPTNIMGTTKRVAELILQGLAKEQTGTRFTMVRFGNVLGSSGSVVPLFRKQIEQGGPITVTHPDIIRYFMTIPEAAELVLQAGSMGEGGDVFVLDMGQPVKIADLAEEMIRLSGLSVKNTEEPDGDIAIEFTGLRPGEKLYEELLIGENVAGTVHPRIMCAKEKSLNWDSLTILLDELEKACKQFDSDAIFHLLINTPTDYTPESSPADWMWIESQTTTNKPDIKRIESRLANTTIQ